MDEEELQSVYAWVDEVPLSRPKKNIARDFCDGVLVAEVVKHHIPKMVELHNYSAANSMDRKMYNWNTLNQRVFKKIGLKVPKKDFEDISNAKTGCIETFLRNLMEKIEAYKEGHGYEHTPSTTEFMHDCFSIFCYFQLLVYVFFHFRFEHSHLFLCVGRHTLVCVFTYVQQVLHLQVENQKSELAGKLIHLTTSTMRDGLLTNPITLLR